MTPMRHAILGAGGVGGLVGACLARCGASVTLVVRRETLQGYPKQLRLESPFGNFAVDVAIAAEVPPADVLWIAVKATQLDAALASFTKPDLVGAIVPLLNGIDHLAVLCARYGAARVIPATIAGETERVSPGHIVRRTPFARLNVSSAGRSLLGSTLDELQKMGFECRFMEDEQTLMWGKIVFLAPFRVDYDRCGSNDGSGHRRSRLEAATGILRAGSLRSCLGGGRQSECRVRHCGDDEDAGEYAQFHAERR